MSEISILDLQNLRHLIGGYATTQEKINDYASQTENKELKQCLKQIRSQCEMSQEKLYELARERSYYVPAEKATAAEVEHVKSILSSN